MKKSVLIVAAAVAVLGIAIGATVLIKGHSVSEWQEQYDLGIRYLGEGKYDEAIIAFTAAINIEPKAPAYANRAQAYTGAGDYARAVEDYEKAADLLSWVFYVPELANAYVAVGDYDSAIELYQRLYDMTGEDMWLERIEDIRNISQVSGSVYAWGENRFEPIENARVTVLNGDNGVIVTSFATGYDGAFNGTVLAGRYRVVVNAEGYRQTEADVSVDRGTVGYVQTIYLLSEEDIGTWMDRNTGSVSGQILDAVNGDAIENARVGITEGWNADPEDDGVDWTNTDGNGRFTFPDLPVGYYTVFAELDGYMLGSENVVASSKYEADWTMTISPELGEGEQLRIVLTWGDIPSDLDSHLVVDMDSSGFGGSKDVYFGNMRIYDPTTGNAIAMLDVDDTTSYGPETVTVFELDGHSFTYMVFDYSSGGNSSTSRLNRSGATVLVYGESGLIEEYHVPNIQGSLWEVFSVDENGAIRTIGNVR